MAVVEEERVSTTVPLNWKEVYFTNCPMVSANNVDQELGWCREEYKKLGVEYAYFRHAPENNWYPHYIHNLDNLIRFGGLYPPIHVHADILSQAGFDGDLVSRMLSSGEETLRRHGPSTEVPR